MSRLDPRAALVRGDLAAQALEGVIPAARYAEVRPMQAAVPVAGVHKAAGDAAELGDQLLFGERFDVLQADGDWAFGQAARDGYVGWARLDALSETLTRPTHWVRALRTYAFGDPSFKARPRGPYSTNALVAIEAFEGGFAKAAGCGWIPLIHLAPLGDWEGDPAHIAERCLGAPYLWGGRDSLGLDCSGLVQQALYTCGLACPRDSDMQAALGEEIDPGADYARLRRNDLVFWRGHVGIMLDQARLLHATARHMTVAVEPLAEAVAARIAAAEPCGAAAASGPPTGFRRLNRLGGV